MFRLLSIAEFSAATGWSPKHVVRMIAGGGIPAERITYRDDHGREVQSEWRISEEWMRAKWGPRDESHTPQSRRPTQKAVLRMLNQTRAAQGLPPLAASEG